MKNLNREEGGGRGGRRERGQEGEGGRRERGEEGEGGRRERGRREREEGGKGG